jgi:hypothetical protein
MKGSRGEIKGRIWRYNGKNEYTKGRRERKVIQHREIRKNKERTHNE